MDRYKAEIKQIAGHAFIVGVDSTDAFVAVNLSEVREMEDDLTGHSSRVWTKCGGSVVFPLSIADLFDHGCGDWNPFEEPSMTASDVCVAAGGISMAVLNCLMSRLSFPRYKEVNGKRLWVKSQVTDWIERANSGANSLHDRLREEAARGHRP